MHLEKKKKRMPKQFFIPQTVQIETCRIFYGTPRVLSISVIFMHQGTEVLLKCGNIK